MHLPGNNPLLCQFFENFLFKNLHLFTTLTLDQIPIVAQKLADDTQAYYKLEAFVTREPTPLKTITDAFLLYPIMVFEKERNTILVLPDKSRSVFVSEFSIVTLLKMKRDKTSTPTSISLTEADIEPFLEAYCDNIRKKHLSTTLSPEKTVQFRKNMMYFIFNYLNMNPMALDQFDVFFSQLLFPNLNTLIDADKDTIDALISSSYPISVKLPYSYIPQFQGRSTVNYYESKNSSLTPPSLPPNYSHQIKNEGSSPLHKKTRKKNVSPTLQLLAKSEKNRYSSTT
jgi:hypothetical protein